MKWKNDAVYASNEVRKMQQNTDITLRHRSRAKNDPVYMQMYREFLILEKQFQDIVHGLPMEQQDIIWEFVFASDALEHRILELALQYTDFSE